MRLLKIVAITLVLIAGPVLLESCCLSDCCNDGFESVDYNIEDISVATTPYPAEPPYPSLPATAVQLSTVAFNLNIEKAFLSLARYRGFQAVACDPLPPASLQTISLIEITSSNEINDVAAGQPLNSLFEVFIYEMEQGDPVEEIYGDTYLPGLSLRTASEVSAPQASSFTFRITLDDGRLFVLVSEKISLVP